MFLNCSVRPAIMLAVALAAIAMCSTAYAGSRTSSFQTIIDGRSPDTLDAAAYVQQAAQTPSDGRSPDTLDAAADPDPVALIQPRGFDWGDAGIGASLAGALLTALFGAGVLWSRLHGRRDMQTT